MASEIHSGQFIIEIINDMKKEITNGLHDNLEFSNSNTGSDTDQTDTESNEIHEQKFEIANNESKEVRREKIRCRQTCC